MGMGLSLSLFFQKLSGNAHIFFSAVNHYNKSKSKIFLHLMKSSSIAKLFCDPSKSAFTAIK